MFLLYGRIASAVIFELYYIVYIAYLNGLEKPDGFYSK